MYGVHLPHRSKFAPTFIRHNRATGFNRSGFTLVELLVVISIIALLISILLPSLVKARHDALRIVCASNLRTLGQACRVYADSYRGTMPTGSAQSAPNYDGGGRGNWPFGGLNGWPNPNGVGANQYTPWGLGLLYSTKMITNGTIFYCPEGTGFTPAASPQYYIGNLGQPGGPPNYANVFLGYCYYYGLSEGSNNGNGTFNPLLGTTEINPTTLQPELSFASVPNGFAQSETSGDNTILASDITVSRGETWYTFSNHFNGGNHDVTGGNVLYNDGHVVWKNASQMQCRLLTAYIYFWQ
ncbi:MAG: type II secretion system protein [Phycisphaerae bacterium]